MPIQKVNLYRVAVGPEVHDVLQETIAKSRKIRVGAFALSGLLIAPGTIPTHRWVDSGMAIKQIYNRTVERAGDVMAQFVTEHRTEFDMLPCPGLTPIVLQGRASTSNRRTVPMITFVGAPGIEQGRFDEAIHVLAAQANQVLAENCTIE